MDTTPDKNAKAAPARSEGPTAAPAPSASEPKEKTADAAFEAARSSPAFQEALSALPEKDREASKVLIACAVSGSAAGVRELAAAGYPMDLRDKDGRTALWVAAKLGRDECCAALISAGADPNAPDRSGVTPADVAWGPTRQHIEKASAKQDLARACQNLKALSASRPRGLDLR